MSDPLDPYTDWLAIPLQRRPPNAYDLLGLTQYEVDDTLIQAAFHERYAKVRVYQVGPMNGTAQRILGELGRAFHTLSDPATKQDYDRQLSDALDVLIAGGTANGLNDSWQQVEQLLKRAGRPPSPDVIQEAEQLAKVADRKLGLVRFAQLVLRRGLPVRRMREILLEHASKNFLSICGNCFGFLKAPLPAPFAPVKISRDGSVVSPFVSVKVSKGVFRTRLIIDLKDRSWKPVKTAATFHRRGRRLAIALAWILLLCVGAPATLLLGPPAAGMLIAAVLCLACVSVHLLLGRQAGFETAQEAVWQVIVPPMLDREPTTAEASFLSGLALATVGSDGYQRRREAVDRLAESSRKAINNGRGDFDHLARCHHLALSDALRDGARRSQGILLFRSLLKECLDGLLPFRALELATQKGELFRQNPQSLTVMIRLHSIWSFVEANLTVADVMTLIENSPTCRALFQDDLRQDRDDVSNYFALFKNGTWRSPLVRSAFELLAATDFAVFQTHANILLQATDQSLVIELRKVTFRGERLTEVPHTVVRQLSPGFELEVNGKGFEYQRDPTEFAAAVKKACYWFFSVLPKEAKIELDRAGTDRLPGSLFGDPVTCIHCKTVLPFVPAEILEPRGGTTASGLK